MAVQNEIPFAIGRGVNHLAREHYAPEIHIQELLDEFVMIAADVNDPGLFAALSEQFLDEDIVTVFPMPFGLQLPAVN